VTVERAARAPVTVGVDVAKEDADTALCVIRWEPGHAIVEHVAVGADDAAIVDRARDADVVALDAPFGWPRGMVEAVSAWRPGGPWTGPTDEEFRLRATDLHARAHTRVALDERRGRKEDVTGLKATTPLSVSADKIAMAAWRCCGLLTRLADERADVVTDALGVPFAIDGRRRVVEAYPAAALSLWAVPRDDYKKPARNDRREAMLSALEHAGTSGWLVWGSGTRERCVGVDHALDAFVCALVARAAALGLVEPVPERDRGAARQEGWIALPHANSLRKGAAIDK